MTADGMGAYFHSLCNLGIVQPVQNQNQGTAFYFRQGTQINGPRKTPKNRRASWATSAKTSISPAPPARTTRKKSSLLLQQQIRIR